MVEAELCIAMRFGFDSQDYNLYGGGGRTMYRNNAHKSFNEYSVDPLTPPRSYAVKNNGDEDDFSPGLLDLHSFDTELLPHVINYAFAFAFPFHFNYH